MARKPPSQSSAKQLLEIERTKEPKFHRQRRSTSPISLQWSDSISERSKTSFKRRSRLKTKRSASAEPELSPRSKLSIYFMGAFGDGVDCSSCDSRKERRSNTCYTEKSIKSIFEAAYAKFKGNDGSNSSSSDLSDRHLMKLSKKVRKVMEDKKLMKRCRRSRSLDGAKEMDEQELASLFGNMNMEQ